MADNNKNPRRTIWLSETEPLSHYDIWLSKNQHLNSEGEPVSDNGVQRPCDYIFKVWDCNNWYPIVGLNSTAVNKIDTVLNTSYTTTHNGHSINSSSYQEFHLPLFTKPTSSPSELFDAGTIGEAVLEYVTEQEWKNIFEGDAFSDAFTYWFPTIINNGDININNFIALANTEQIGGIKAEQDPNTSDDCRNIPIVLAGPTVGSVWGLDFGTPGRRYLGDSDYDTEYLYLPGWALMEWMKNPYLNQQNPQLFISGWKGVDTQLRENSDLIWVGLSGVTPENVNRFCTIQLDNTDPSGATINWVDLSDYGIYPVLSSTDNSANKEYVINGGGKEGTYLNWKGEWTDPNSGNIYYGEQPIVIDYTSNTISISPQQGNLSKLYLCSENNNVSWQQINTGQTYIGGIGITINNTNNSINIDTTGASTEGQVLSYDGHGDVEWRNIQSGQTYTEGVGIQIGQENDINSEIEILNGAYTASSSITFNCVFGTSDNPVNGINMLIDNTFVCRLKPFSFIKVNTEKALSGTVTFNIITSSGTSIDQKSVMKGDPVFIELELGEWTDVTFNCPGTYIDSNGVLSTNEDAFEEKHVLATLQFGITKLEAIHFQQTIPN